MGGNKICNQVEGYPPPNGAKDVARQVLHSAQEANRVIDFWEILNEKHQEHRHHHRYRSPLQ